MNPIYSYLLDIALVAAFITDRVFRIRSLKEYKEAKQAQIDHLKQQLEFAQSNNDIALANQHKERYESLKIILDEKAEENNRYKETLLTLQSALQNANEEVDIRKNLNDTLIEELNRVEKKNHDLELEARALSEKLNEPFKRPAFDLARAYFKDEASANAFKRVKIIQLRSKDNVIGTSANNDSKN